jgi:2-C-methyl-D-erythritol 4-phosphate cytidylyltransferase
MRIAVILPAAGSSSRYIETQKALGGPGRHKIDEDLGGRPMLHRTVELFSNRPEVVSIIVAGPASDEAFESFSLKHADRLTILGAKICRGGRDHRYETVQNALKLVDDACTHVAVHDAARPCASAKLIDRVFAAAQSGHKAVIPGVNVADTIKQVGTQRVQAQKPDPLRAILGEDASDGAQGRLVERTLERSTLVSVQTPQVFEASLLRKAYAQADLASTDDAQLVERLGEAVLVVEGEATNLKVTRAGDIELVRAILGFKAPEVKAAHARF